jgi:type IV pilus assembly protein PilN
MRIQLNLASRPYVELGPLYLRLRILIGLLVLIALPLWLLVSAQKQKAAAAQARIDAVDMRIRALQSQKVAFQAQMREPQNAAVLTQAQFLNQLFASKAFSWTAVMMDLENVLPSGVQVLNIDPVVAKDGKVTIRLRVSGAHDKAVELVRNLEHSHRFLAPRLARETAENGQNGRQVEQVSATSNVNFDLLAEYNPLPEKGEPAAKTDRPAGSHSTQKKTAPAGPKVLTPKVLTPKVMAPKAAKPGAAVAR